MVAQRQQKVHVVFVLVVTHHHLQPDKPRRESSDTIRLHERDLTRAETKLLHLFVSGKGADEFPSSSKHQHPVGRQAADVFWEAVTLATITG